MKASQIAEVFEQIAPLESGIAEDRQNNYLGFRFGDRDIEVTGVGVAWWLAETVVKRAIEKKLNFLICHEPQLFRGWNSPFHSNLEPAAMPYNLRKMKLLLEHDICVYTAHSNWDAQLEIGMGPTLAKVLGFTDLLRRDVMVGVYKVGPLALRELICHVKAKMNLEQVRYQGNLDMEIRNVVLAWGAMGSEVEAIVANRAEAGIFGELREWPFLQALESGVGIIETTHVVSESLGCGGMGAELRRRLPRVPIEFLEVPFPFKLA